MATDGDWTLVQPRRRRDYRKAPTPSIPNQLTVYNARPTFAQVVQRRATPQQPPPVASNPSRGSYPPRSSQNTYPTTTHHSRRRQIHPRPPPQQQPPRRRWLPKPPSPPSDKPNQPKPPSQVTLPESPTTLRFPPSPSYEEWFNRCFSCFQRGHLSERCTNDSRCVLCWGTGHRYTDCRGALGQDKGKQTFRSPPSPPQAQFPSGEPSFADLLDNNNPNLRNILPPEEERPKEIYYHIARDNFYHQETQRLSKALVVTAPPHFEFPRSAEFIANQLASTGLVKAEQLQIGNLTRARHLVLPPRGVTALQLGMALPESWWEEGYQAALWSPALDAEVEIPIFKAWITLSGVQPHHWRETYVAESIGRFATFLGTIPSREQNNMATWDVAIATPDLRRIPLTLVMTGGSYAYPVHVGIKKWIQVSPHTMFANPNPPPPIHRPSHRQVRSPTPPGSPDEANCRLHGDTVTLKISSFRQIFHGVNPANIPPEIAPFLLQSSTVADTQGVVLRRSDLTPAQQFGEPFTKQATHLPTTQVPQKIKLPAKRSSSIGVTELQASVLERSKPHEKSLAATADSPSQQSFAPHKKAKARNAAHLHSSSEKLDIPGSDEELVDYSSE